MQNTMVFRSVPLKKRKQLTSKKFLFLVLVGVVSALLLRHFAFDIIQVTSSSMNPTLKIGRRYLMNKFIYHTRQPQRNDIVAFPSPVLEHHNLVKRVIAIAGETLEIKNKVVYIDNVKLIENYAYHSRDTARLVGDNLGPLEVPIGMVFVMGDNRDESEDSRDWKDAKTGEHIYFIPVSRILGKIFTF